MKKTIGIIGFGRFGRLAARYLKKDFSIFVYDKFPVEDRDGEFKEISLKEICRKNIIIICVPVSSFEELLIEIKDYVGEKSLIVDVCAVKEYTCNLMSKYLPSSVEILGTHPLFGPDSAKRSLRRRKLVLTPVRIDGEKLNSIKTYLRDKGLSLLDLSPDEHDRQISRSLVLTHFIGRAMIDMELKTQSIETLGYQRLLKILSTVQNDTWELFEDMNKYNKYAENIRETFLESLKNIDLKVSDKSSF